MSEKGQKIVNEDKTQGNETRHKVSRKATREVLKELLNIANPTSDEKKEINILKDQLDTPRAAKKEKETPAPKEEEKPKPAPKKEEAKPKPAPKKEEAKPTPKTKEIPPIKKMTR